MSFTEPGREGGYDDHVHYLSQQGITIHNPSVTYVYTLRKKSLLERLRYRFFRPIEIRITQDDLEIGEWGQKAIWRRYSLRVAKGRRKGFSARSIFGDEFVNWLLYGENNE